MKFYGELLILVLLLITNGRSIFVKKAKLDPLVVLSPLCVLLSILQIAAWGLDVFAFAALIISVLVVLSNFHALFRYSEHLYIDHYSPLMKIWAALTITLSAAAITALIYFAPVDYPSQEFGITETESRYSGNFAEGFKPTEPFRFADAFLYEFTLNPEVPSRDNVVVFIPDKRGDTINYKPYLQLLAKAGYTVYSADFYTSDCRWLHSADDLKIFRRTSMVLRSLADSGRFNMQKEFYTYNASLECRAMMNLITDIYGEKCRIFLVTDSICNTAADDFMKLHPERISGTFHLDSVSDYKSAGYGCVEQTDIILAKILGLRRDTAATTANLLVQKTAEKINSAWGIK